MTRNDLAGMLDHSVLKPESTAHEILAGVEVVRAFGVGFYCVQPCWVRLAADALAGSDARVVSVVGFPHGCDRPDVKGRAAALAVSEGAREIDTVMNFGALRSGDTAAVTADIEAVVRAASGIPVKVILETSALNDEEKRLACRLAVAAGAAFVKTSTGFHPAGGANRFLHNNNFSAPENAVLTFCFLMLSHPKKLTVSGRDGICVRCGP